MKVHVDTNSKINFPFYFFTYIYITENWQQWEGLR